MNTIEIKNVLEAALLCSSEPLSMTQLRKLFNDEFNAELLRPLLDELALDWDDRSVELAAVASGWRFQSKPQYAMFINRLTPEKAPKYSRAAMETLAIIAYRQPVTRGDIEEIRGVSVGSQIVKTLEDRGWIDVIGHKEVPGRPALFATTKQFLDDLNLLSIKELPPIDEMAGEESVDFFGQQVTEALENDGGSKADSEDATGSEPPVPGAQESDSESDSPLPHADLDGDSVSNSAPSPESEVASDPLSELHLESSTGQEQAGDGEGTGPDAANDQDGADVPVTVAALAVGELSQENDVADLQPGVAEGQGRQADEPGIVEVPEAVEAAVSDDESGHPERLAGDGSSVDSGDASDQALPAEPDYKTELVANHAPANVAADGDFLAAATAEAVAALSEGDNVASDGPIGDDPTSESSDTKPAMPMPDILKPSGLAVDDPNLEQVDWPDLPSLDGLDDAAQESSEQTSEQDPPGGESEPVESR